jgi:colanic acid biosynthesis glycosyl transferase WcaI
VMDLYPDVIAAHGGLSPSGWLYRLLGRLTRRQLSGAALVLALGPRMRERVACYVSPPTRLEWTPLWGSVPAGGPDPSAVAAWRARRGWAASDCVFLYSGNMGLGHRLGELLEAAGRLGGAGPVWAFAGGGRRREEVERFAAARPDARVQLLPYVAQDDVVASLAAADVHLVSLRSPWQGLIVPSKLPAAFGLGRPVVYVGPRDSEPADWTLESGGGWVAGEGDVAGVLAAVASASVPEERRRRGEAGRAFARARFDREANTRRIAELLEEAVSDRRSGASLAGAGGAGPAV